MVALAVIAFQNDPRSHQQEVDCHDGLDDFCGNGGEDISAKRATEHSRDRQLSHGWPMDIS